MNGKLILSGRVETYPFRIPMPLSSRIALIKAGIKVRRQVLRYASVTRQRPGEDPSARQQRIYDFENGRSFRDFTGDLPEDADALFGPTVTRSAAEPHEISAGAGIGYFSLVWNIGQGLNRGILGGPSTLTEGIAAALGDRVQLGAEVTEIVHKQGSVVVRYRQAGVDREVEARYAVVATPATVSHRIAVDIPQDIREALGKVVYSQERLTGRLPTIRLFDNLHNLPALTGSSLNRRARHVGPTATETATITSIDVHAEGGPGGTRSAPACSRAEARPIR
jgi:oxygen-dependent protoporphyrinogen oxidase